MGEENDIINAALLNEGNQEEENMEATEADKENLDDQEFEPPSIEATRTIIGEGNNKRAVNEDIKTKLLKYGGYILLEKL